MVGLVPSGVYEGNMDVHLDKININTTILNGPLCFCHNSTNQGKETKSILPHGVTERKYFWQNSKLLPILSMGTSKRMD